MTKNIQLRQIKEKSFRTYCNKMVDLIKINRKSHYKTFFEESKKSFKTTCAGIHSIIYSKKSNEISTPLSLLIKGNTIPDSQDSSEHCNNFLTLIGQDLQKNIAPTKKHFSDYLKTPNTNTIFISPTTPKEISTLIKALKNSKRLGPNSIPTNKLKEINETISIPLSTLINKLFIAEVFPNLCQIVEVVPIFKSETRLLCDNLTLQSPYLLTLQKNN